MYLNWSYEAFGSRLSKGYYMWEHFLSCSEFFSCVQVLLLQVCYRHRHGQECITEYQLSNLFFFFSRMANFDFNNIFISIIFFFFSWSLKFADFCLRFFKVVVYAFLQFHHSYIVIFKKHLALSSPTECNVSPIGLTSIVPNRPHQPYRADN